MLGAHWIGEYLRIVSSTEHLRRNVAAAALAALTAIAALAAPPNAGAQRADAMPIPEEPGADAPSFIGGPAQPNPVSAPKAPRHPFMAPNERSNIHDDAYMTDTYATSGPLGRDMKRVSTFRRSDCASVTFDSEDRIETICVGLLGPQLVLLDPRTLDQLATFSLPPRQGGINNPFTDFSGGGYFYLDDRDRAVIPTTTQHVFVVAQRPGPSFERVRNYDLTSVLQQGDSIVSALPDFSGLIWFVSTEGIVGNIDPETREIEAIELDDQGITNSFAVDEDGGVYIVTDRELYRFEARNDGTPKVIWRKTYPNTGEQKPGQVDDGSGTTPTVMGRHWVAITDNDDPMNVVVYRRGRNVDGARKVCSESVFEPGRSATDNSLIVTRRSIVVENNFGYRGPQSTFQGGVTAPGIERVDVEDGKRCTTDWRSDEISPTVVPKLSLGNGLVYAYTKNRDSDDPWYLTAIDFRTGKTVYKRLAGFGLGFNNNYAPVSIGPDGTAYVGVLGGLVALRDTGDDDDGGGGGGGGGGGDGASGGGEGGGGTGDASGGAGGSGAETTPTATRSAALSAGAGTASDDGSSDLPFTGLPLVPALVAGACLAAGGAGLARRARR